ncbi:MAG: Tad domain-containing protein [Paracoccaceae bacterium]|nr:Tad domain-containing protein [Paracoccaceae bacterium]
MPTQFLDDEQGGYTVWSLLWFMLFVGLGGLAVDFTDGYRTQSLLQASSDSGALAGVLSPLRDETEVDN